MNAANIVVITITITTITLTTTATSNNNININNNYNEWCCEWKQRRSMRNLLKVGLRYPAIIAVKEKG